jgi:hypothetical protein
MSLLLPISTVLAASFAAGTPDAVARQRAARVRASLLTKDWDWLRRDASSEEIATVLQGIWRWFLQSSEPPSVWEAMGEVFVSDILDLVSADRLILLGHQVAPWVTQGSSPQDLARRANFLWRIHDSVPDFSFYDFLGSAHGEISCSRPSRPQMPAWPAWNEVPRIKRMEIRDVVCGENVWSWDWAEGEPPEDIKYLVSFWEDYEPFAVVFSP